MKTFNQFISEAFDKPYPYDLEKEDDETYYGYFRVEDNSVIQVMFYGSEHIEDYEHSDWNIEFQRNGSQAVTGEGDAMRIFATVIKIIEEFLKQEKPKYASFSAFKPDGKEDRKEKQSREKLYSRLVKRFASKMGYGARESSFSGGTSYSLTRKK